MQRQLRQRPSRNDFRLGPLVESASVNLGHDDAHDLTSRSRPPWSLRHRQAYLKSFNIQAITLSDLLHGSTSGKSLTMSKPLDRAILEGRH